MKNETAQHTPERVSAYLGSLFVTDQDQHISEAEGKQINSLLNGAIDLLKERLVNAELLEALKAIDARLSGEFDNPALVKYGMLSDSNGDISRLARRAISKAEGKEVSHE